MTSENIIEVLIVGSGFGGLTAALNLKKMGINDFVILERRAFFGGTWKQNVYPGAAVDVPSPLYSIDGEPFPWEHLYAKQKQLAQYTEHIIEKHNLAPSIELCATVIEAKWCKTHWQVKLENGKTFKSKIIINATGPLSSPAMPNIHGLQDLRGQVIHSNNWHDGIDLNNKLVAIVGSGASAVQIIPSIINRVKKLHVFQRTPHWVLSRFDYQIPKRFRATLALRPINFALRTLIYWLFELRVIAFKYSPALLRVLGAIPAKKHLLKQVENENLRKQLTPYFTIGCKRILVSDTYYPALQHQNTVLHTKDDYIEYASYEGLQTKQSGLIDADLIILATGYNPEKSMVSYHVIGEKGKTLGAQWRDYPRAYLGTSMPNFPNFFIVTGPNTGIGHTSALFVIESQMKYIMNCIKKLHEKSACSIQPTPEAEEGYTAMVHSEMEKTVWYKGRCNSWYKNEHGKVIAMFPGFSFSFRRLCKKFAHHNHIIK